MAASRKVAGNEPPTGGKAVITHLRLSNFRSIHNAEATFERLTVLIGANGAGKSNVIKSLEFIASLARVGLEATTLSFGGFLTILPKSIPRRSLRASTVELEYTMDVGRPAATHDDFPLADVTHKLSLGYDRKRSVKLRAESIRYHDAYAVGQVIHASDVDKEAQPPHFIRDSAITIYRRPRHVDRIVYAPEPDQDTMKYVVAWLGYPYFGDSQPRRKDIRRLFKEINSIRAHLDNDNRAKGDDPLDSLVGPTTSLHLFSPQANRHRSLLTSLRRYDLLQNELRQEQQAGSRRELSTEGKNMPSVLQQFISKGNEDGDVVDSWSRILATLTELNPHIKSASVSSLRTGKNYVEFIEENLARRVESWDTSDGTLRVLAIMLALETQTRSGTVILEEPEQNLHPWAVRSLMQYIREVSKQRNIQVIVTTHSEQVLEMAAPNEVLLVTRSVQGGTELRPISEVVRGEVQMGDVGRLWVKGLLGGVPSYE